MFLSCKLLKYQESAIFEVNFTSTFQVLYTSIVEIMITNKSRDEVSCVERNSIIELLSLI